jgi:hypothetical protein
MGFFHHDDSDERQAYEQVDREGSTCECESVLGMEHNAETARSTAAHEIVAGAASFMAMRAYEQKQEREGKPERWVVVRTRVKTIRC